MSKSRFGRVEMIEYRLIDIKLDVYDMNRRYNTAQLEFEIVDRGKADSVKFPRSLYFNCSKEGAARKSVGAILKIKFKIYELGLVFVDKSLIRRFDILDGWFSQSFVLAEPKPARQAKAKT